MISSPPAEDDGYDQLSDSDDALRVRDSQTELTIVPADADLAAVIAGTAAHDPEQALQFVKTLTSVREVVGEVAKPQPLSECMLMPGEPADLDLVVVGCWDGVIHVSDPGLASDLADFAETEVLHQRRLRPRARVVSKVFLDMVADFAEVIISVPGMEPVREFNDSEETRVEGDLPALLQALGIDKNPELDFQDLERHARGVASFDDGPEMLLASTFHVRRPEDTVYGMEDVWLRQ